jgi:hypothetical protein
MENYLTKDDSKRPPHSISRRDAIKSLPTGPLFADKPFEGYLSYDRRVQLSVARAKAIVEAYGVSASSLSDVSVTSARFDSPRRGYTHPAFLGSPC